jgi:DNA-binding CsgD family transcriptional regulator
MTSTAADISPIFSTAEPAMNIAALDRMGTIVAVNAAWQAYSARHGLRLANGCVGVNYLDYCGTDDEGVRLRRDIVDLLAGRVDVVTAIYPCASGPDSRWNVMIGVPVRDAAPVCAVPVCAAMVHIDFTDMLPAATLRHGVRVAGAHTGVPAPAQGMRDLTAALRHSIAAAVRDTLQGSLVGDAATAASPSIGTDQHRFLKARLTRRQCQVLALVAEGKSNGEIAAALACSPNTVKLHVAEACRRLGVKNRTEAMLLALKLPRELITAGVS